MRSCAASTETPHKCHRCGYPPITKAGAGCVGPTAPCEPFTDPDPDCGLEEQADCVLNENGFEQCTNWTSASPYCGRLFCQ